MYHKRQFILKEDMSQKETCYINKRNGYHNKIFDVKLQIFTNIIIE